MEEEEVMDTRTNLGSKSKRDGGCGCQIRSGTFKKILGGGGIGALGLLNAGNYLRSLEESNLRKIAAVFFGQRLLRRIRLLSSTYHLLKQDWVVNDLNINKRGRCWKAM